MGAATEKIALNCACAQFGASLSSVPFPDVHARLRDLAATLLPRVEELGVELTAHLMDEIPMYRAGDLVTPEDLRVTSTDNLRYILGRMAGLPGVAERATPEATGTARAEAGVPFDAVLEAFRVGGRFLWEQMVRYAPPEAKDDLILAAADIWAITDELSAQVTKAYRTVVADRARRDAQARTALVGSVLDGPGPGQLLWEAVRALDLPHTGEFVVVSAETPAPGAEGIPGIETFLQRREVSSAWRLDQGHQDGLVSLRPGVGLQALVSWLEEHATGRVGISSLFTRVDAARRACEQARSASSAASPGSVEIVRYEQQPFAVLLARVPDRSVEIARQVLEPVLELPTEDAEALLDTVRVWLECAGATSRAASRLHVHRNTVGYRLRRVHDLTGLDPAQPLHAARLHLALEAARVSGLA